MDVNVETEVILFLISTIRKLYFGDVNVVICREVILFLISNVPLHLFCIPGNMHHGNYRIFITDYLFTANYNFDIITGWLWYCCAETCRSVELPASAI